MFNKGTPRLRKSRSLGGVDIDLTSGIRPIDTKCKLGTRPGVHGAKRTRQSDYGVNLKEKQKFCWTYGLSNGQLRRMHKQRRKDMTAKRRRSQDADYGLHIRLESRVENIVFRMGFAATRAEAGQLLQHKAILVNGQPHDKRNRFLQPGDLVEVRDKSKNQARIAAAIELAKQKPAVDWVKVSFEDRKGEVVRLPNQDELPAGYQENLVIQFYSK